MKRAIVVLLIASMLSTCTVYASDNSEVVIDAAEYAEEYSQSGGGEASGQSISEEGSGQGVSEEGSGQDVSGEASGQSGSEEDAGQSVSEEDSAQNGSQEDAGQSVSGEGSGQEEYTDHGSENSAGSGDYSSEAEPAGTEANLSDGSESAGDSDETAEESGGDEAASSMTASESDDEKDAVTENPETVPDSGNSVNEASVVSKESSPGNETGVSAEESTEAAAGQSMDAAVSNAVKAVPPARKSGTTEGNATTTRIAIMSDIHYVTDRLVSELGRQNLKDWAATEFRLMEEIDAILTAALEGASKAEPEALLICGDLVSNGELLGARTLAEKLKAAKEKNGFANTGFYVVNGNHDINNSYAADFTDATVTKADRVQPSDFAAIFSGLGYGDDDHCEGGSHSVYKPVNDDPSQTGNHGGLSYAADIADGITLIVLDTGIYRTDEDEQSMYNDAQKTAGYVSDDLLKWAAEQARAAKAKGNFVLAMSHHGLLPHYDTDLEDKAAWYMDSFRIPNWEKVAETLADAGVSVALTGHTHANDIASYVSKNNNVLYDVETAALCAYPCLWRAFEIVSSGEGEEKTYTISIDTTYINDDLQADTSNWSFTIGDKTKTFDGDYHSNLQEYAYDKTGINERMLEPAAMYMVKNTLSDIINHKDGLGGYIKEQLEIPEDQSLGEYAAGSIRKLIDGFTGFAQEISSAIISGKLSLENMTKEGDENPAFKITADLNGRTEYGKAAFDLSYIPTAINELIAKTEAKLREGNWLKNPYTSNPLLDDIQKLIKNAVVPALTQPLDENDPDSAAVNLVNDAWQSFAKGDEGLADEAQKAKWEHERELLDGEKLAGKLTDGLWKEAVQLHTSRYPTVSELLSQRIVEENKKGIITITTENPGDYMIPAIVNLLGITSLNTLSSIIRTAGALNLLGEKNPLPSSVVKPITDLVVDLHEFMTSDHNITHDNTWDFQMVRFDANGGHVGRTHALTVEDHKLINLPTPDERAHYTFDGWFTSETGGRKMTADDDMTGINTLYAHWTYVGEDKKDDPAEEDEKTVPAKPDDQDTEDDSRTEPSDDKEEDISPAKPSGTEQGGTSKDTDPGERTAWNLHDYFVSRKALHEKIYQVEYDDVEHTKYCDAIVSALKKGETIFHMGPWLSLDANAVTAIEESKADVTLEYIGLNIGFRVLIPAGSKISRFADDHGYVCIVCLAEYYGYKNIRPDEVLRQPLL